MKFPCSPSFFWSPSTVCQLRRSEGRPSCDKRDFLGQKQQGLLQLEVGQCKSGQAHSSECVKILSLPYQIFELCDTVSRSWATS